jgi:hypothetical protein
MRGLALAESRYPARPSLGKLKDQLDAAWPNRLKMTGGNVSDASIERDRGVLDVPESPFALLPSLSVLQAAVRRDGRVAKTEVVSPSFRRSPEGKGAHAPHLDGRAGDRCEPVGPLEGTGGSGREKYGSRPRAAGETANPFADLDAGAPPMGTPTQAVNVLLAPIDQRWPKRVRGPIDGLIALPSAQRRDHLVEATAQR